MDLFSVDDLYVSTQSRLRLHCSPDLALLFLHDHIRLLLLVDLSLLHLQCHRCQLHRYLSHTHPSLGLNADELFRPTAPHMHTHTAQLTMATVLVLLWLMVNTTTLLVLTPQASIRILLELQVHVTILAPRHHLKLVTALVITLDTTATHSTNTPHRHIGTHQNKLRSNTHHHLFTTHLDSPMSTPRIAQPPLPLKVKFLLLRLRSRHQSRLNDRAAFE